MNNTGYRCQNCIDEVYMDDLGDGFYKCPVCGNEFDERYQFDFDFDDEPPEPPDPPEDDDYPYPEYS